MVILYTTEYVHFLRVAVLTFHSKIFCKITIEIETKWAPECVIYSLLLQNAVCHVMNQTVDENVHCDGEKDARGCDSPSYRVLTQCLCRHMEAAEETFDNAGRGS